jgi:hypothetical protein
MDRREFLLQLATGSVLVGLTTLSTWGCSDSGESGGSGSCGGLYGPPCSPPSGGGDGDCSNDADVDYTNVTHAHTEIQLTGAQIAAAAPGAYLLLGAAVVDPHTHTFDLSAQDFLDLQAGMTVTRSEPVHGHIIDITC